MTLNASIGRRLLRAGTIAATFAAWPAVAQQPAPQPAAPAAAAPTGPAAAPPWAQGRPEAAIGGPACAKRTAANSDRRRQAADREAEGAEGLQDRALCGGRRQCAHAAAGGQGHGVRRAAACSTR